MGDGPADPAHRVASDGAHVPLQRGLGDGVETVAVVTDARWEQWATRGQYETYLAWRTETGALDKLVAMLDGPPSIRFLDHVGV